MAAGLFLALALVAGVTAIGPSLQRVDLSPTPVAANAQGQSNVSGQPPSIGGSQASAQSAPISAVSSLSTEGSASLGLLFVPILAGIAGGAVLYLASARRIDSA